VSAPLTWALSLALAGAIPTAGGGAGTGADPGAAAPAARPGLAVEVTGECPGREAVHAALLAALGRETPGPSAEPPRVTDLGDRFEMAALGQTRQVPDPERDCAERARTAAVFIALALNPPAFQARAEPAITRTAPPAAPPAAEPAGEAPSSPRWSSLALAARVDGVPADGSSSSLAVAGGAELTGAIGRGALGIVAGAAILAPTDGTFSGVIVRQQRFPLNIGVTVRHELARRFELAGAAGLALVPFTLRGEGLGSSLPATRLDTGARLACALRFPVTGHLTPFVGLHAELFPRAYVIDVDPLGSIGSTGRFRFGASLGLSFDSR
jgi:hypothetical protein